ncbi:predicted protein [Verticillium alfalfae VaMs.102]|uniref:Predicted protein n=1 Tax=Verticillium alfalfae (strain VaMs.102 / ATCC MYA-4576 / FGSC 10136) TaxID=526221 RepID=C9SDR1_VERA1|nr:predicted protein [Verticillium alfalfae VaMs.102]EEY17181.1 predicted protein [Verticillium alfalfae VaMs.102]
MDRRTDPTLLDDYSMETRGPIAEVRRWREDLDEEGPALRLSRDCGLLERRLIGALGLLTNRGGMIRDLGFWYGRGSMMGRHGGQHGQARADSMGRY